MYLKTKTWKSWFSHVQSLKNTPTIISHAAETRYDFQSRQISVLFTLHNCQSYKSAF